MSLFIKKLNVQLFILSFFACPLVWAQTIHHFDLSSKEIIDKGFWNPLPNKCAFTQDELSKLPLNKKIAQKNGFSKLMIRSVDLAKQKFGSQEYIEATSELMKMLTGEEKSPTEIDFKKFDDRFCLLFLDQTYYLVDMKLDCAYLLLGSVCGNLRYEIARMEKITGDYGYKKISDDAIRVFFKHAIEYGRLTNQPLVTVYDIDFRNHKFLGVFEASGCEDLRRDGMYELVVQDEVDFYINWSWVYRWVNGCWVDSSSDFPEFYKTIIASGLEKLIGVKRVSNQKILKRLIVAANNGGPCCQK